MWSYVRSVTARNHYEESNHGLHKSTAYLMIGGDRFYYPWIGYIKNMKFFYGDAISKNVISCYKDEFCSYCS